LLRVRLLLGRKGVGIDVALHVAQMAIHAIEGALAVARGDRLVDLLVRGGMHRLALEAMSILAETPPGGIAPAGAKRVEQRQEQGIARSLGDRAVETLVGLLIDQRVGGVLG